MEKRSRRRRVVTTCTECNRRKQKCNREKPCNICCSRNVPEKCHYDLAPKPSTAHNKFSPTNSSTITAHPDEVRISEEERLQPEDLTDQVGYACAQDSNAFTGLEMVLGGPGSIANSRIKYSNHIKQKYASLVQRLPPVEIVRVLLDAFFDDSAWYIAVIERRYFNQLHRAWNKFDMKGASGRLDELPRELQYFPALLFQVIAVVLQFAHPSILNIETLGLQDAESCDRLSEEYTGYGLDLMTILGRQRSSMTAVQSDLMRALWLKNCSRGTESWYSLCDGIRQAQDLGLHLQSTVPPTPDGDIGEMLSQLWFDEYKRRIWATLYSWDAHMALMLGRPRTINASDCTIRTPMNCDFPDNPCLVSPTPIGPREIPSSYSVELFHYELGHIVHQMLSAGAHRRQLKDYTIVEDLHNQLILTLQAVPPSLRPDNPDTSWDASHPYLVLQRQNVLSSASAFLVALHRPHIALHAASRHAAIQAAIDCLNSQQRLFEGVNERYHRIYSLSFKTIDSALFLTAVIAANLAIDPSMLGQIHPAICQAITRLNVMREKSPMAKSGAQLIAKCYEKTNQTNKHRLSDVGSSHQPSNESGSDRSPTTSTSTSSQLLSGSPPSRYTESTQSNMEKGALQWSLNRTPAVSHVQENGYTSIDEIGDFSSSMWSTEWDQYLTIDPEMPLEEAFWDSLIT